MSLKDIVRLTLMGLLVVVLVSHLSIFIDFKDSSPHIPSPGIQKILNPIVQVFC